MFGVSGVFGVFGVFGIFGVLGVFGIFGVLGVLGVLGVFGVFGMLAPATLAHISLVFAFVLAAKTGVKIPASNSTTVKLLSIAQ